MQSRKTNSARIQVEPETVLYIYNNKKKVKNKIIPLRDEPGVPTQYSKHMARILNANFTSIFTAENMENIPKNSSPPREIKLLKIGGIRKPEVKRYLGKLETNKSTRPDDLPPRLLKELKQQTLPASIIHLCN